MRVSLRVSFGENIELIKQSSLLMQPWAAQAPVGKCKQKSAVRFNHMCK